MMPKMDGMETTKKIRDMGYKHSIVALTANAIVGQAEMFLANGFDGFISKPIDSRELNAILNNMIRDKRQSNLIHKETQNEPDSIPKIISEELVMAALRDIENAVVTLNNILPALDASNEEDIKQLVTTIHGIKSALANIGEKKLSDAALKLEKAGNDKNMDIILDDMSLFIDVLLSLKEKYKSAKKNNG
jgi:CheY-like chemotaxis protein